MEGPDLAAALDEANDLVLVGTAALVDAALVVLGVNDTDRTARALRGIVGKRLTYTRTYHPI